VANVVVSIVGFRNAGDIRDCLRSLALLDETPCFDVFIAENGGVAGMDALLAMMDAGDPAWERTDNVTPPVAPDQGLRARTYRLAGRKPGASYVYVAEMAENLGYAGGVNAWLRPLLTIDGWKAAWILNPDTEPHGSALAELADCSARRNKGMVSSLVVRDNDPAIVATRGLQWQKWTGRCLAVGRSESAFVDPDVAAIEATITSPSGASIYVTRALIERIGLMYDPYFLYCEDLEWGEKAVRLGELGYAHKSVVVHKQGTALGSSTSMADRSPLSVYLGARNAILFTWRNYPAFLLPALAMQIVLSARYLLAGAFANFQFSVRGVLAGCLGETGRPDPMPTSQKPRSDTKAHDQKAPSLLA
jgi:N-acetylglucosaminyl-diphospho-decaprenol L-rhamnosyltransferase